MLKEIVDFYRVGKCFKLMKIYYVSYELKENNVKKAFFKNQLKIELFWNNSAPP